MGNICGKSDGDAFAQPGRVLGSAPAQPQRASVPDGAIGRTARPPKVGGPPRTLGGSQSAGGESPDEARRRAAEAAEARAQAATSKASGKLGTQLAAQRRQTHNETLKEHSNNERRQRDVEAAAKAMRHD
ncbi:hypothetical protein DL771_008360 [Monosporascus sp. 5C6A]|nr:hypothetical protein DL771_008360 [Monosporascus sp. 5C6A]